MVVRLKNTKQIRTSSLFCCDFKWLKKSPHLIFQLIVPVHFMLTDIKIVSGVVVHRLREAADEKNRERAF